MNIGGISTYQAPSFRMMDCGNQAGTAFFESMASETKKASITLYLPNENTVYSGGRGNQTVYAEYTQASIPEDPIVRIKGVGSHGEYEFIRHLSDIDPRNVSYAELCALWGHLKATGQSAAMLGYPDTPVLPYGIDVDDVLTKRDYASLIEGMTTSTVFDPSNQRTAQDLLDLYLGWNGDVERPASLGASAPPRFIEGPGYCFPNPAFDAWLEEMAPVYAAREAERLANLPTAHTRLDDAAVKELAEKYGGGQMSQNQYDDFLDELVHRGVLTRDEIKYMGYQGLVYIKPHDGGFCYQSDEYGNPLEDANGNSLDWAKKLMEYLYPDLTRAGLLLFAEEQGIRPAFEAMLDVLERMGASR